VRNLTEFRAVLKRRVEDRALRKTASRFGVALFDSIHYANAAHWDAVVPDTRLFLTRRYLAALEASNPTDITFRYAMLFDGQRPVAVISAQLLEMSGASVGSRVASEDQKSPIGALVDKVRGAARNAADTIETRVLLCGNSWVTGEHGFACVADVDQTEIFHGLAEALYRMRRADKLDGQVAALLIKDFPVEVDEAHDSDELERFGYKRFSVDPQMVVPLRDWKSFDDYLAAMTGKYRRRVKSARKKGSALQRAELDATGVAAATDWMHDMLDAVANKATLRLTTHPREYFTALKNGLGDAFRVFTYSIGEQIVGFRTTIYNHDSIEGHYLGIDYEHNTKHAIYQNILYDYIEDGLAAGAKNIWLGRTALEIKSSIGAEPRPMRCFIRHRNPVGNRAVKPLFRFVKPTTWTPRNPFDAS
tara:strand:- start:631 stop:1887 length:1257 start_codon:yes stop_codon:yes gene_type:complete